MKKSINIFAYKGMVGATSDIDGTFINDVKVPSQIGVIAAANHVGISKEAIELIKSNYVREGGSFASTMINLSDEHVATIGLLGFHNHLLSNEDGKISISRDCELESLDKCDLVPNEPPLEFIEFVDELENEKNMN